MTKREPTSLYYADTDTFYIDVTGAPSVDSDEITDGIVVNLGAAGEIVGVEVDLSLLKAILEKNPVAKPAKS